MVTAIAGFFVTAVGEEVAVANETASITDRVAAAIVVGSADRALEVSVDLISTGGLSYLRTGKLGVLGIALVSRPVA